MFSWRLQAYARTAHLSPTRRARWANMRDAWRYCWCRKSLHQHAQRERWWYKTSLLLSISRKLRCQIIDIFTKAKLKWDFLYCNFPQLLRECVSNQQPLVIQGPLGEPPFESPPIAKAITNFVYFKYNHLPEQQFNTMTEVAKAFLHCMNNWNFETPKERGRTTTNEDSAAYKINYTRWLMFCHVPAFCSSLPRYETTMVFGRSFLKSIFQVSL